MKILVPDEVKKLFPDAPGSVTHKDAKDGGVASIVSRLFHKDLSIAIRISSTRKELAAELKELAEEWLPNGTADLSIDLQNLIKQLG